MVKRVFSIALLILSSVFGFAQNNTLKPNSISIELGGAGIIYSINYDRTIINTSNSTMGIIAGIGVSPFQKIYDSGFLTAVPIQLKIFKQLQNHAIEFGGALAPVFYNEEFALSISGHLGYKYTFPVGFYVSIAFTPLLNEAKFNGDSSYDTIGPLPWGAIRFGHKF